MNEEVEYLGVVLDQAMKWSCIIDKIVSKSIFLNFYTETLQTCNILLTNICSKIMLKHIFF